MTNSTAGFHLRMELRSYWKC